MSPENKSPNPQPQLPYEAPRVVEDLPLETYSLACGSGPGTAKSDSICAGDGLAITS
ncbi:MAG: hypothetical protein IPF99_28490 [Deltaproteobacteria bacterium]|nr:hypothetical protein [Deltaproteobacteria bacterium]